MEWGTKEFNHFLRTLFPGLFRYLGTLNQHVQLIKNEADDTGVKRINYTWPYILLRKDRKKYEAVDHTHPSGSVYRDNLSGGSAHASFRGKAIFLGTHSSPTPPPCRSKHYSHKGADPTRGTQSVVLPSGCTHTPTPYSCWKARQM